MASTTVAPETLDLLFHDELHRYELVDGELRSKPMVSILHSLLMTHLGSLLLAAIRELDRDEELWVLTDPLARIRTDHWRRPDVAVLRAEDAEEEKYVMPGHWPVLCIELVSIPDQTVGELLDKCKLYHAQGVRHCWVLEPESRTAWAYDNDDSQPKQIAADGQLTASSLGIELKLDEIWRGLHNKRGNKTGRKKR